MTTWYTNLLHMTFPFALPELPYSYQALEPHIDAQTMLIHHTKHHQAYVDNLNACLDKYPELQVKTLEWLLTHLTELPQDAATTIRNHGGGHYNHSLFWRILSSKLQEPSVNLCNTLSAHFGSVEQFTDQMNAGAMKVFGSGWVWLCKKEDGQLIITTTPNQNSPLSDNLMPVLGIDVWEHAYYLKFQNRRKDYLSAIWHVIAWDMVEGLLQ